MYIFIISAFSSLSPQCCDRDTSTCDEPIMSVPYEKTFGENTDATERASLREIYADPLTRARWYEEMSGAHISLLILRFVCGTVCSCWIRSGKWSRATARRVCGVCSTPSGHTMPWHQPERARDALSEFRVALRSVRKRFTLQIKIWKHLYPFLVFDSCEWWAPSQMVTSWTCVQLLILNSALRILKRVKLTQLQISYNEMKLDLNSPETNFS